MKYAEDMQPGENSGFDAALTRALERRDEPVVPVDFAARVAASLPPARKPRRTVQAGRIAGWSAAAILAVALFALAPHAAPGFGNLAFDFELVVIAELGGIAYWLTTRGGRV